MRLYDILSDRKAVCILKLLYDKEVVEKSAYSFNFSDIKKELGLTGKDEEPLANLDNAKLIGIDDVEGEKVLTITKKGKHFIEVFDQLVDLFKGEPALRNEKQVSIKYELTEIEKKILLITYKISKESGAESIPLKTITTELFPHHTYQSKAGTVSRYAKKLEEINLLCRKKEGNLSFLKITEFGIKALQKQHLEGVVL